ncbi:MAG: metallophosphoesterase [Pseudomonadota bacterium]|nr:metallophosphoesterase [Pseudomonadota bacterium]
MLLAQISDTHIALDAPDSDQRLRDFADSVSDILSLAPAPDAIVHTGDIVHNGRPDEYAEALAILAPARLRIPVYVIPGNKDNRAHLLDAFSGDGYVAADSPFFDYSVDDLPIRLIALDTLCTGNNKGDFCAERAKRLAALIGRDEKKPIAVICHHPPFEVPVGPDPVNFITTEAMQRLRDGLSGCERIKGVLCGHVHRFAEGKLGHIPAVVTTSVATMLRKGEYPAAMKGRPVYYLHHFDAKSGLRSEIRVAGAVAGRP